MGSNLPQEEYEHFFQSLKERIQRAQLQAALSINRELNLLYWHIGREILQRQQQEGWGAKVIERLAKYLKKEFPDMGGFSRTNLLNMRAFAEAYPDEQIVATLVGQIPWGHNLRILERVKDPTERLWYIQQTIEHGWSRNVLVHQIESGLHARWGSAITNFDRVLPQAQSDLAVQILKDPYNFSFLSFDREVQERELEKSLVDHIRDFLLEMGVGFSFLGSQYPIEVSGKEFRLDLLFYHVRLHCYVVIDLKIGEFEPEFSGKMAFYVSAVDNLLRTEIDQPTIGLILCKSKDRTIVEYSLQPLQKPISVATYRLKDTLPEPLQGNLPTIAQLEMELKAVEVELQNQSISDLDGS
ncbi:PDDEXK nuclease domain-containing protein [Pantanalinema rosaneae CENA516]|uniref:PDDEXK nuclease domain-containing protein n=1 Tax=Pantanalinema rosaneae TaxID=1620701 RepID=UPI003D6F7809